MTSLDQREPCDLRACPRALSTGKWADRTQVTEKLLFTNLAVAFSVCVRLNVVHLLLCQSSIDNVNSYFACLVAFKTHSRVWRRKRAMANAVLDLATLESTPAPKVLVSVREYNSEAKCKHHDIKPYRKTLGRMCLDRIQLKSTPQVGAGPLMHVSPPFAKL